MEHFSYAAEIIKHYEGLHLKAYYCPAGVLTIGWGDTIYPGLTPHTVITREVAEQRLLKLLQIFDRRLSSGTPGWTNMTNSQKAALISFSFNLGWSYGAPGFDTLNRAIKSGEPGAITSALRLYNKADGKVSYGLQRRRMAESQMYWGKKPQDAIQFALTTYP